MKVAEMTMTPEGESLLYEISERIHDTPGKAIHGGLILLQMALDAKREGKRLVIVDDQAGTEEEIEVRHGLMQSVKGTGVDPFDLLDVYEFM